MVASADLGKTKLSSVSVRSTSPTAADPNSPSDLVGLDAALRSGDRVRATGSGFPLPAGEGPQAGAGVEAASVTLLRIPR